MQIDPDSRHYLLKELHKLVSIEVDGLVTGTFQDMAAFERQRGVIVGLGATISLLENNPATPNGEPPQENIDGTEQD